jgi:hypothetical protein
LAKLVFIWRKARAVKWVRVCETKDECGNTKTEEDFGFHNEYWWEIVDSGTEFWITTVFVPGPTVVIPDPKRF